MFIFFPCKHQPHCDNYLLTMSGLVLGIELGLMLGLGLS